jgi:hypothetical protein
MDFGKNSIFENLLGKDGKTYGWKKGKNPGPSHETVVEKLNLI